MARMLRFALTCTAIALVASAGLASEPAVSPAAAACGQWPDFPYMWGISTQGDTCSPCCPYNGICCGGSCFRQAE